MLTFQCKILFGIPTPLCPVRKVLQLRTCNIQVANIFESLPIFVLTCKYSEHRHSITLEQDRNKNTKLQKNRLNLRPGFQGSVHTL